MGPTSVVAGNGASPNYNSQGNARPAVAASPAQPRRSVSYHPSKSGAAGPSALYPSREDCTRYNPRSHSSALVNNAATMLLYA